MLDFYPCKLDEDYLYYLYGRFSVKKELSTIEIQELFDYIRYLHNSLESLDSYYKMYQKFNSERWMRLYGDK